MNKVILIGRLTKDPELRYAPGTGTGVSRFTVAVNRRKKEDGADFINCVAFGKTAETISQYLTKGRQIAITGSIRTGSYDKDGVKHYTTDVAVDGFEFIGSGNGAARDNADSFNGGYGNSNSDYSAHSNNNDVFGAGFNDDITPVDDGDMPF